MGLIDRAVSYMRARSLNGESTGYGVVPAVAGFLALVACLLLACASKQPKSTSAQTMQTELTELRAALLADIADSARAQQAAGLVDQLAQQDREARETAAAQLQRALVLDANYDATEDDFRKLFAEAYGERVQRQNRIVELWTQMAALTTDAEWDALKKSREAAAKALTTPG